MPKKQRPSDEAKVEKIVTSGGIKRHIFLPSGIQIWTVVGNDGEYIQLPDRELCTCPRFFFALLRGDAILCHHIKALKVARNTSNYRQIEGHDSELPALASLLLG
jgi:predicted nucleic acid-binding Zn finger protein